MKRKPKCRHPLGARHYCADDMQWCEDCGGIRYEYGWSGTGKNGRETNAGRWRLPAKKAGRK